MTAQKQHLSFNVNSYVLPQCNLSVFKRSFANWSLFTL